MNLYCYRESQNSEFQASVRPFYFHFRDGSAFGYGRQFEPLRWAEKQAVVTYDNREFSTLCATGSEAIWLPGVEDQGIKVIFGHSDEDVLEMARNTKHIQDCHSPIFPEVLRISIGTLTCNNDVSYPCLVIVMENMNKGDRTAKKRSYINWLHRSAKNVLDRVTRRLRAYRAAPQVSANFAHHVVSELQRCNLVPYQDWWSAANILRGKIIDFHRFRFLPGRYAFPTGGATASTLRQLGEKHSQISTEASAKGGFVFPVAI